MKGNKFFTIRTATKWLAVLAIMPSFFSVVFFCNAVTPENSNGSIPATWSAGVNNHGTYFEWYTISDRPILFAVSVCALVMSVGRIAADPFLPRSGESWVLKP